jgi:DNA-binding PadR family transcriptional regulator
MEEIMTMFDDPRSGPAPAEGGAAAGGFGGEAGPGGFGGEAGPGRWNQGGRGERRFREGHGHCGPHGFGPHGFGPHGFGPHGRARRGNVRAAILAVLAEQPMHGYEVMQQLESRSGGIWRPSPGSVYPTLQLLEDQGLIRSEEVEGRRVFSLTDEGKAEAATITQQGSPWAAAESGPAGARFRLRAAAMQLMAAVRQVGAAGSPEQVDKALEILTEARKRLYGLLAEAE